MNEISFETFHVRESRLTTTYKNYAIRDVVVKLALENTEIKVKGLIYVPNDHYGSVMYHISLLEFSRCVFKNHTRENAKRYRANNIVVDNCSQTLHSKKCVYRDNLTDHLLCDFRYFFHAAFKFSRGNYYRAGLKAGGVSL